MRKDTRGLILVGINYARERRHKFWIERPGGETEGDMIGYILHITTWTCVMTDRIIHIPRPKIDSVMIFQPQVLSNRRAMVACSASGQLTPEEMYGAEKIKATDFHGE